MFQCIESYVSKLKSENAVLVEKVTRQDAEINRLQSQLNAATEERDSFGAKVSVLYAWCCALFDGNSYVTISYQRFILLTLLLPHWKNIIRSQCMGNSQYRRQHYITYHGYKYCLPIVAGFIRQSGDYYFPLPEISSKQGSERIKYKKLQFIVMLMATNRKRQIIKRWHKPPSPHLNVNIAE